MRRHGDEPSQASWEPPQVQPPVPQVPIPETSAGYEYVADVNKGDIRMDNLARKLNDTAAQGWRLHTIFEQHGNTVTVFERPKP
jgi:hypothetical protein